MFKNEIRYGDHEGCVHESYATFGRALWEAHVHAEGECGINVLENWADGGDAPDAILILHAGLTVSGGDSVAAEAFIEEFILALDRAYLLKRAWVEEFRLGVEEALMESPMIGVADVAVEG